MKGLGGIKYDPNSIGTGEMCLISVINFNIIRNRFNSVLSNAVLNTETLSNKYCFKTVFLYQVGEFLEMALWLDSYVNHNGPIKCYILND